MTNKNTIFSGIAWSFSERILAQVVSFVVSIVLARLMLPESYGIVAMVTIFINIANVFVSSGFSTALVQDKNSTEKDFSTIFWCTLFVSITLYIALFFSAPVIARFYDEQLLIVVIRVFSIKLILSAYNSVQHAYVSRYMLFKKFFFSTFFGTAVSGVVGIVMAYCGFGVWALVAQYLLNSSIDLIVLNFTINWHPKFVFSIESARRLMKYGWKILFADLIGTIYDNLRQLLIGKFYTSADLAYYNKGKQIPTLVCGNIDASISSVLFPAISNEADDKIRVKMLTRKSLQITSYTIFPIMFGIAAVAEPLINVLLTDRWASAAIYMRAIAFSKAIATLTNANLQSMKAVGRSDVVLKIEMYKKPVGVAMILISLPISVLAVAISMPLYSIYAAAVNMRQNTKLLDYKMSEQIKDIIPALTFSTIMFFVVLTLTRMIKNAFVALFGGAFVGVSVYIGLSLLFKNENFFYLLSFCKEFVKSKIRKG